MVYQGTPFQPSSPITQQIPYQGAPMQPAGGQGLQPWQPGGTLPWQSQPNISYGQPPQTGYTPPAPYQPRYFGGDISNPQQLAQASAGQPDQSQPSPFLEAIAQQNLGTGRYNEPMAPNEIAFMKAIRNQESGGNYGASNPSGAQGAYQILGSNWPSWAQQAGVDPNDHSPAAQNAVAQYMMDQMYNQDGNWGDVAAAWYGGGGGEAAYASGQGGAPQPGGPPINTYVQDVLGQMGGAGAGGGAGQGPGGGATDPVQQLLAQLGGGGVGSGPANPNITNPQDLAQAAAGSVGGLNAFDPQLNAFLKSYLAGVVNPTNANIDEQVAALMGQIGLSQAGYGLQATQAQQDYQNQAEQIWLTGMGYGIQGGALTRQTGEQQQLYGLTQQQEALQSQNLAKQLGFTEQGIGIQRGEAEFGAQQQQRAAESSATASGAIGAPGTGQRYSDIATQLGFQKQQLGLQEQQAQYGYTSGMQQLGISSQQQAIQNQEAIASNKDAQGQLNIMEKQLGISGTEITQRLQNTLGQLGISQYITVDQLLQEIYSVEQGKYSPISGLLSDIYAMSGVQIPVGG